MPERIRAGAHLKRWRRAQDPKPTQSDVGELVGLSGDAIRHFENGTGGKTISLSARVRLCGRMGCKLETLLDAEEMRTARRIRRLLNSSAA